MRRLWRVHGDVRRLWRPPASATLVRMADTLLTATDEDLMLRYGAGDLPAFRE